jgi:predicted PurR-regulated permease PerM
MNDKQENKKKSFGPERLGLRKNRHYAQISGYVVLTALIIYILFRLLDNLPLALTGIGSFFRGLWVILKPLTIGFVFAWLLYRPEEFFRHHMEKCRAFSKNPKRARPAAVAVTYIIVFGALALIMTVMISSASHEIKMLSVSDLTDFLAGIATSLQSFYSSLQDFLSQLNISSDTLDNLRQQITEWLGNASSAAGSNISSFLSNMGSSIVNIFIALILSIYFLLDAPGLMRYWDNVLKSITGKKAYQVVHTIINDVDTAFSGYLQGQLMDACFMLVAVSVTLSLLGVRFSVLIGLLTGIGNLIPYLGPIFAYCGTALSCILSQDWKTLIIAIIVIFILQTADGNIIGPKLLSRSIHVHPMLVIIAIIIGSAVGGFLGMLVSVPIAALLKGWFDRLISYIARKKNPEQDSGGEKAPEPVSTAENSMK